MSRRPAAAPARPFHFLLRKTALALLIGVAVSASAASDERVSRYYEDALVRFEKKDHAGAIIQLKNAIQIDRSQLAVQVLLGRALLADAQPAAAEVALLEALRLGVDRAEVAVTLAQVYIAQGKQQAIFDNVALKSDGLAPSVRFSLLLVRASAASDLRDGRRAMAMIDEARAIDATSPDSWLAEVPVRVLSREFALGAQAADKAVALGPRSAEAWYQKGTVHHVRGDLNGALSSYERAISLQGDHIDARLARVGLLIDLDRVKDTASDLAELKRLAPREPRAVYLSALLAEREGDREATRRGLAEVTALLDPVPVEFIRYRPQLLLLNGLAHFSLNEFEKAKPYLETLQRTFGQGAGSKLLAQIYLNEKNPARAAEVLETYLRAHRNDRDAVVLLASAQLAQGGTARATSILQEAVRAEDTPALRGLLGLSLLGGGHVAEARTELEAAFKRDPSQIQAGVALVNLHARQRDTASALRIATALVKQRPNDATLHNLLGLMRVQAGDAAGARASFEQSLKLDPAKTGVKLNLARIEQATGAVDAAEQRIEEVLKVDERSTDAMVEMAAIAQRRKQPEETLRWLQRAVDIAGPRDTRPGLSLVDFHLRQGQRALALEAAKRLTSKAPEDLTVLHALGRAQVANADLTGARTTFASMSRLAGFDAQVQVRTAGMQVSINDLAGAAYSLDKALTNNADHLPALALLAEVETRQAQWAKAEQRARRIVQPQPRLAVGPSLLGDLSMARGQQAAAVDFYRQAHQLQPRSESFVRLFTALSQAPDPKPAFVLADGWLKANPGDRPARRTIANTQARKGLLPAARASYEALLKSAPNDADLLNNLANVMLRMNDKGAVTVAERAMAADPNNANIIDTAGWAAFHAGQTDRALQLLRDARLRDPGNAETRYHLAAVLAKAGRRAEALQEVNSALRDGRFESMAEAQALAQTLR